MGSTRTLLNLSTVGQVSRSPGVIKGHIGFIMPKADDIIRESLGLADDIIRECPGQYINPSALNPAKSGQIRPYPAISGYSQIWPDSGCILTLLPLIRPNPAISGQMRLYPVISRFWPDSY